MTTPSSDRRTLEQRYAANVHAKVQSFADAHPTEDQHSDKQKNIVKRNTYGGMAHKLPVLIRTAGLMQALHFASTRKKEDKPNPVGDLVRDLAAVLDTNADALLARTREASVPEYMHLTRQVLAVLVWFKRFAQSILDVDGSEQTDDRANEGAQP